MNGVIKPFPGQERGQARESAEIVRIRTLARRGQAEAQAMVKQRRQRTLSHKLRMTWTGVACGLIGLGIGSWIAWTYLPRAVEVKEVKVPVVTEQTVYVVASGEPQSGSPAETTLSSAMPAVPATSRGSSVMPPGKPSPPVVPSTPAKPSNQSLIASEPSRAAPQKPLHETLHSDTRMVQSNPASQEKPATGVFEASQAELKPSTTRAIELKVIGIPVDGVLQLEVNGVVRQFKPGQVLPNGETLLEANSASNRFKTNKSTNREVLN